MGETDARTLLLEAIEGSLQQPVQPQQPAELHQELQQNVAARATWWSHVRDQFFLGEESDAQGATHRQKRLRGSRQRSRRPSSAASRATRVRFLTQRARVVSSRVSRVWTARRAHAPPPQNQVSVGGQPE